MKRFWEFLKEEDSQVQLITDVDEVRKWMERYLPNALEQVNPDGSVDLNESVQILKNMMEGFKNKSVLPVKFNKTQAIDVMCPLDSFVGSPRYLSGIFGLNNSHNGMTSFEGLRISITYDKQNTGGINLSYCNGIKSLSNIHKYILECPVVIVPTLYHDAPLLSILLIKNIEHVASFNPNGEFGAIKPLNIVNRHLGSGKDVLDCQEELIKSGFKAYAKL